MDETDAGMEPLIQRSFYFSGSYSKLIYIPVTDPIWLEIQSKNAFKGEEEVFLT